MYKKPSDYKKEIKLSTNKDLQYQYFCDIEHPLVMCNGTIYYHRHVASMKIGRWLQKDEQVHHINENRLDNRPENLEVCSQSEHMKIHRPIGWDNSQRICPLCKQKYKPAKDKQTYCSNKCATGITKKFIISKEDLKNLVWKIPASEIAKIFGVSDNAIGKRCKKLGIKKPTRGYWQKQQNNRTFGGE